MVDELHELSVKCSQEIKSGKERINLLELLRKHFAEFEIHLDGDTDRLSLELYKASFIETLYHIFKLARHSKGNELYIYI
ncbi:MAG: hypothetical protein K0Q51_1423 [Rickettsiaceae bacterium]|jgi:hypothetical protein|nr:hypothetical protein [Rickettsiaceae bacterium]